MLLDHLAPGALPKWATVSSTSASRRSHRRHRAAHRRRRRAGRARRPAGDPGLRRGHIPRQVLHPRALPRARQPAERDRRGGRQTRSPRRTSTPRPAPLRRRSCRAPPGVHPRGGRPRVGLRGFNAVRQLKRDYAWAIDLQICVFRRRVTNDPGAETVVAACEQGADLIGGCPYTDIDPRTQMARIFELARRFDRRRLPSRFRHRPVMDAPRRGVPADRRPSMGGPGHGRSRHQAFGHRSFPSCGGRPPAGRCRRGGDGAARHRSLPHGARARPPCAARRRARASAARSRRRLLARHQQRAQPVHAVRRLLADPHGQPLCQRRASRARGRDAHVPRHGDDLASAADESADYGVRVGNPADLVVSTAATRRWR